MKKLLFIFLFTAAAAAAAAAQSPVAVAAARALPPDFRTDGCTLFPDGNYCDCCAAHDLGYYAGGSWRRRWRSDRRLFRCVAAKPKFYNKLVAPVMWLGVRVGGVSWLKRSFSWGFGKRKRPASKTKDPKSKCGRRKSPCAAASPIS